MHFAYECAIKMGAERGECTRDITVREKIRNPSLTAEGHVADPAAVRAARDGRIPVENPQDEQEREISCRGVNNFKRRAKRAEPFTPRSQKKKKSVESQTKGNVLNEIIRLVSGKTKNRLCVPRRDLATFRVLHRV